MSDYTPFTGKARAITLGDVIAKTQFVPEEFFIPAGDVEKWRHYKGAKRIDRASKEGYAFTYSEGAMAFPDPLDRPARTIITGEGGGSASRCKHVVRDRSGRLRRLLPDELEELMGFPHGFTDIPGIPDARRAFLMGNALLVGVVRRIGAELSNAIAAPTDAAFEVPEVNDSPKCELFVEASG